MFYSQEPLDIEAFMGQFSPNPSPTRLKSGYPIHLKADYSDDLVSSMTDATSYPAKTTSCQVNSPYIPTEDEIETLESMGTSY